MDTMRKSALHRFWSCGRAYCRSETGTAFLELAVVLPLLILFVIGAAEFGRLYFTGITVANAARAGAQFGAQNLGQSSNLAGMTLAAQDEARDLGTISNFPSRFCRCSDGSALACSTACGTDAPQVFVKDSAVKSVSLIIRYPGLPNTVNVSRVAVFRVQ
jgi:hypothetical protein